MIKVSRTVGIDLNLYSKPIRSIICVEHSRHLKKIVEDVPVLLLKNQTQTWKILKFVKLLNIESKSWFQIVENVPVLFVEGSDANLEVPYVC